MRVLRVLLFTFTFLEYWTSSSKLYPNARPPIQNRTFISTAIEEYLKITIPKFKDSELATIFSNALPNTLDTTVYQHTSSDSFIITGDIEAMWLRDSTRQVSPYIRFITSDSRLSKMLGNLVLRQAKSINISPYSNAFNIDGKTQGGHPDDVVSPTLGNYTFEGKYELDSIVSFLKLSSEVYGEQIKSKAFASTFLAYTKSNFYTWVNALHTVLGVIEAQQLSTEEQENQPSGPNYTFQRKTDTATDTLFVGGRGMPSQYTGMSRSEFRPSDDSQILPYYIPSNAFAVVELEKMAVTLHSISGDKTFLELHSKYADQLTSLADRCSTLTSEIDNGIKTYGMLNKKESFAFEVDGYGNQLFMDDANIPGLLSLPSIGYVSIHDQAYQNTRAKILSTKTNPYYFEGTAASGVGGAHCGYGYIWPMAMITRIQTSDDEDEIVQNLGWLKEAARGTAFMHESFNQNDFQDYTRSWFAWANSLFAEMIMDLMESHPHLIIK
ncbi:hypothetical protein ScalyP_jg5794 [Parmales sp. scaly parma]|nr:hypothetical protein ScalyP_jg5794 [Parmales sp. scaly parma]